MGTPEQITFNSPDGVSIPLLVNPETLTLTWKKVINRVRTKTRLITYFWGEEPVKFTYRGQTGNTFPTLSTRGGVVASNNADATKEIGTLNKLIDTLQKEIRTNGPFTGGDVAGNLVIIDGARIEMNGAASSLLPNTNLLSNALEKQYTNTQILYLSEKFKLLKKLETLYRRHQNPSDELVSVQYRDYIFQGYFESFSYTDDAKNPWNWIYNIDFTILDWENDPATLLAEGKNEIKFVDEKTFAVSSTTSVINTTGGVSTTTNSNDIIAIDKKS